MSVQEERLTAIANAIREKDGTTGLIPASDFASRILAIKTGSDFAVPLVVTADAGAVVTAVNGDTILTAAANENDAAVFSLEKPGEWSIEASLDGRTLGPKTVQVTDRYEAEFSFESRLPKRYTEVEYIESDGTQYIDTGIKPTANTIIAMNVEPLVDGSSTNKFFFDSLLVSGSYTYAFRMAWNNSGIVAAMGRYATISTTTISSDKSLRRMVLQMDASTKTASVDGAAKTLSSNSFSSSVRVIRLFNFSGAGTGSTTYAISAKLYSCQMYEGDVPTRDFVPCIDPTGAVGLYDLVEGKFYGNADTGTFAAGPAI